MVGVSDCSSGVDGVNTCQHGVNEGGSCRWVDGVEGRGLAEDQQHRRSVVACLGDQGVQPCPAVVAGGALNLAPGDDAVVPEAKRADVGLGEAAGGVGVQAVWCRPKYEAWIARRRRRRGRAGGPGLGRRPAEPRRRRGRGRGGRSGRRGTRAASGRGAIPGDRSAQSLCVWRLRDDLDGPHR